MPAASHYLLRHLPLAILVLGITSCKSRNQLAEKQERQIEQKFIRELEELTEVDPKQLADQLSVEEIDREVAALESQLENFSEEEREKILRRLLELRRASAAKKVERAIRTLRDVRRGKVDIGVKKKKLKRSLSRQTYDILFFYRRLKRQGGEKESEANAILASLPSTPTKKDIIRVSDELITALDIRPADRDNEAIRRESIINFFDPRKFIWFTDEHKWLRPKNEEKVGKLLQKIDKQLTSVDKHLEKNKDFATFKKKIIARVILDIIKHEGKLPKRVFKGDNEKRAATERELEAVLEAAMEKERASGLFEAIRKANKEGPNVPLSNSFKTHFIGRFLMYPKRGDAEDQERWEAVFSVACEHADKWDSIRKTYQQYLEEFTDISRGYEAIFYGLRATAEEKKEELKYDLQALEKFKKQLDQWRAAIKKEKVNK